MKIADEIEEGVYAFTWVVWDFASKEVMFELSPAWREAQPVRNRWFMLLFSAVSTRQTLREERMLLSSEPNKVRPWSPVHYHQNKWSA